MTKAGAMVLVALLNALLEGGPKIWAMIEKKRQTGQKVTLEDIKDVEDIWSKPGEEYFDKQP